jgi:hypothetical protein
MGLHRLANLVLSRKPRYVTIAGLLVTDGVVATDAGFTHASFGRVTQVEPHDFHGGPEAIEPEAIEPEAAGPWWETAPDLLASERVHMAEAFPGFQFVDLDGKPGWEGTINSGRGLFEVRLTHRGDHSIPRIEVIRPHRLERRAGRHMQRAPHLFNSGAVCVARAEDWDAERHDAVTAVGWAAHWLAAYSVWRVSGEKWPTRESHAA